MINDHSAPAKPAVNEFISEILPYLDISNVNLQKELKWIFERCDVKHVEPNDASVLQYFIVSYPEINLEKDSITEDAFTPAAIVYLHLRNGLIYGIELIGDIDYGIDRISDIGAWLGEQTDEQIYDDGRYKYYETCLNRELDFPFSTEHGSTLRMLKYAPIAPCDSFLLGAMNKIYTAILSLSQGKYCVNKVKKIREIVSTHFTQFSSSENLISSFRKHLDIPVMNLLESLDAQFDPYILRLHVYNYFMGGGVVHKNNRIQAVSELPWITPLIVNIVRKKWRFSTLTYEEILIWSTEQQCFSKALTEVISDGQFLSGDVAELFKVSVETIEWTKHRSMRHSKFATPEQLTKLLQKLMSVSVENRPKDTFAWENFLTRENENPLTLEESADLDRRFYEKARSIVIEHGRPSVSLVQRHLRIGYNHSVSLLESMVGDILSEKNIDGFYTFLKLNQPINSLDVAESKDRYSVWADHPEGRPLSDRKLVGFYLTFSTRDAAIKFGTYLLNIGERIALCEPNEYSDWLWGIDVSPVMFPSQKNIDGYHKALSEDAASVGGKLVTSSGPVDNF